MKAAGGSNRHHNDRLALSNNIYKNLSSSQSKTLRAVLVKKIRAIQQ